ncbi:MAG TPA: glycosyltransferase family 2 protein [Thermoanaerobaculia bacterium]|nr:glycosyltransferase family 2 protein [Thermoanaerobaculia bacterium]
MKFSVVIPMYNRAAFIGRTLRSCLQQEGELEVIVVDDGSSDGSVDVVRGFDDPRIRIVQHETNRGVGPARNTGVDLATGDWIVPLDSDDELLPGAIAVMERRAAEVGDRAQGMRFMTVFDDGGVSPEPPLDGELWDYERYIRWAEACNGRRQETLVVVRRETFAEVRYCDSRAYESLYHLDFAERFDSWACPDVVRLYHRDAANQITRHAHWQFRRAAADHAQQVEQILERHGSALAAWAPRRYRQYLCGRSTFHFLAGNRRKGFAAALETLRVQPFLARQWVVLAAGVVGTRPLSRLRALRRDD